MEVSADISLPSGDAAKREKAKMRLYVLFQLGGWGAILGLETWSSIAFPEHDAVWNLSTTLAVALLGFCSGLLISHSLRPLMARWRWKELGWRSLLPRLVAAAFAAAAVWIGFECLWVHGVVGLPWNTRYSIPQVLVMEELYTGILFCSWLCLYFFYHLFDRLNRSEIERFQLMSSVKEAELRALKSQVNPHFIFNSLNSLRALIDEDPARARMAVTQLANLLRYSLQSGQLETVPFEEELGVVNDYLALEQVRHEERLRLRLDIAPDDAPPADPAHAAADARGERGQVRHLRAAPRAARSRSPRATRAAPCGSRCPTPGRSPAAGRGLDGGRPAQRGREAPPDLRRARDAPPPLGPAGAGGRRGGDPSGGAIDEGAAHRR